MTEPYPTASTLPSSTNTDDPDSSSSSSLLSLLKAFKEVQERRVAIWKEYQDAFETFLSSSSTTTSSSSEGCRSSQIIITNDMLTQILNITTQGLIQCSHRTRQIQHDLSLLNHSALSLVVASIQSSENSLLKDIVERDQYRRLDSLPSHHPAYPTKSLQSRIDHVNLSIGWTKSRIAEQMAEIYAQLVDLQQSL